MNSRLFRFDFDRTHFGDHGLESSTISCPADTLYSALCVEALRMGGQQLLGELVACSTLRLTDLGVARSHWVVSLVLRIEVLLVCG